MRFPFLALAMAGLVGCSDSGGAPATDAGAEAGADATPPNGSASDAATDVERATDAAPSDATANDATVSDGGANDATATDAAESDVAATDAAESDVAATDAAESDAAATDAAESDAATDAPDVDASAPDATSGDASPADAAPTCDPATNAIWATLDVNGVLYTLNDQPTGSFTIEERLGYLRPDPNGHLYVQYFTTDVQMLEGTFPTPTPYDVQFAAPPCDSTLVERDVMLIDEAGATNFCAEVMASWNAAAPTSFYCRGD